MAVAVYQTLKRQTSKPWLTFFRRLSLVNTSTGNHWKKVCKQKWWNRFSSWRWDGEYLKNYFRKLEYNKDPAEETLRRPYMIRSEQMYKKTLGKIHLHSVGREGNNDKAGEDEDFLRDFHTIDAVAIAMYCWKDVQKRRFMWEDKKKPI